MSSRPRRSAAQRATAAITDMADRDNERTMSSRARRSGDGRGGVSSRGPPSSPASSATDSNQHVHLNVKVSSSKLRQATASSSGKRTASASHGTREAAGKRSTRGPRKSYVVESDDDEEDEEEEEDDEEEVEEEDDEGEDEIEVGDVTAVTAGADDDEDEDEEDEDMEDLGDEDAEGEEVDDDDDMDVDAEGEDEDAEGEMDVDVAPAPPTIKVSKPSKSSSAASKGKGIATSKPVPRVAPVVAKDDDDDEELSELDSDAEEEINETVEVAGGDQDAEGEDEDLDAEGEEIEVADEDAEGEEDEEVDSDEEGGSRADTPNLARMTARQRAKHGDVVHEYMKLSDEVQVKKHLTAEELSMRRAEMARRRRNLSEKRNEEVKMETINKLLKKQAPKTNRRVAMLPGDETPGSEEARANPLFIRWVSTKEGSRVSIPDEMVTGPMSQVFGLNGGGLSSGKMVEEVL